MNVFKRLYLYMKFRKYYDIIYRSTKEIVTNSNYTVFKNNKNTVFRDNYCYDNLVYIYVNDKTDMAQIYVELEYTSDNNIKLDIGVSSSVEGKNDEFTDFIHGVIADRVIEVCKYINRFNGVHDYVKEN